MSAKQWILITGGTGFIGFALAKSLLARNYNVKLVTRQDRFSREFQDFVDCVPSSQLMVIRCDIKSLDQLERGVFEDVYIVYHVAALVNSTLPYEEFYKANVVATENICELSLKNNVSRIVYVSTSDVFGLPKNNVPFTESSPYQYWSESYPDTKIDATKCVKAYVEMGLAATIIYPGWVYGPGDKAFLPSVLTQLRSGIMPIWDKSKFKITYVYIDDLVEVLISILTDVDPSVSDDLLILNASSSLTLVDLTQRLATLFDLQVRIVKLPYSLVYTVACLLQTLHYLNMTHSPLITTNNVKSFGRSFTFTTAKATRKLNWRSQTPFDTGLLNWKEWYLKYQEQIIDL